MSANAVDISGDPGGTSHLTPSPSSQSSLVRGAHAYNRSMAQPVRVYSNQPLPVEVLDEIFAYSKDAVHLMRVSRVCSLWRAIMARTPDLWTVLSVSYHTMPAQVEWQLAKSGGKELDVTLRVDPFLDEDYADDDDIDGVRSSNAAYASNLQKVFAESSRIRKLKVTLYHVAEWPDLVHGLLNDRRTWPRLTHLFLGIDDHWEDPATFDMVLPELQVLHLESITAVDWARLKLGPALSLLDIRDAFGFREMSTQLPPCYNIRKIKLMDSNRTQDVLSFDALDFGTISFPQLEELTIWWETIHEQSLVEFLAACPNLRDLDVTIENLVEADIVDDADSDMPDYTLCLTSLSLSIIESGLRQDLFALLASKLSGEYLRALTIDNLLLDARTFLPFLLQCRSTLQAMHFQCTHLTNVATTSWPAGNSEFPRLSTLKLDLQLEPTLRFSNSHAAAPPGDIDLTTSLFLSMLPPSPPARSMDVSISGAHLLDEYIRRLVEGIVGPGPIRLDMIYHDYGGRPPEHEIRITNDGHPATGKPFTCSFTPPNFAYGIGVICMVSDLQERIVRLSVDTSRAPQVFLGLPDSMPNLTQIDLTGATTIRVSEVITRILIDRAGRPVFDFPNLTAVVFRVGPETARKTVEPSGVRVQLLQLFLLTLRSVETLDEIHSVFRGLEFLDCDDGLLPQIQSLYHSRAQEMVDSGSDVDR